MWRNFLTLQSAAVGVCCFFPMFSIHDCCSLPRWFFFLPARVFTCLLENPEKKNAWAAKPPLRGAAPGVSVPLLSVPN